MANTGIYDSDFEEGNSIRSANDSDDESLVNVDAPADGYFTQRSHPQETYVDRQAQQAQEAKDREAAAEAQRNASNAASNSVFTEPVPVPVLDAGPAPPDYAAATADRRHQQRLDSAENDGYGSITPSQPPAEAFGSNHPLVRNGLLGDQAAMGASSESQRMSEPPTAQAWPSGAQETQGAGNDPDEETGLLGGQRRKRKTSERWCSPRRCVKITIIVGIIVALIVLIGDIADSSISNPSDKRQHDPTSPPDDITPPHKDNQQCTFTSYSRTHSFAFSDTSNFTFTEMLDPSHYRGRGFNGLHITGTTHVSAVPAESNEQSQIRVSVNVATTNGLAIESLAFHHEAGEDGKLEVLFPELSASAKHHAGNAQAGCLSIAVEIEVRKGSLVNNWEITTANTDVSIAKELFQYGDAVEQITINEDPPPGWGLFTINDGGLISTIRGNISAPYWSSRNTRINTISGNIEGTYALRDELTLSSASGTINVNVSPKEVAHHHPKPADFTATTVSGPINVYFPAPYEDGNELPSREYNTRVESKSARIEGIYLLGYKSSFRSTSGAIDVFLRPVSANLSSASVYTETKSAKTRLALGGHTTQLGVPDLHELSSHHKSVSGKLSLMYPEEWAGTIMGKTVSGGVNFSGKGVKTILDEDLPGQRHVVAQKLGGSSKITCETLSGKIGVLVGDGSG